MLYHASIGADDPALAARVIAELWQGEAMPFPFVGEGSWIAFAGDDRNTVIEVYRHGTELFPADGDQDAVGRVNSDVRRSTPVHLAIASPLSREEVESIGAREGWLAKYRKRGDTYGVIELWVDNAVMIEVLTPDMQQEYLQGMTTENYRDFIRQLEAA